MTQNEISPISRQKVAEVKNLIKTYGAKGFQTKVLMGIDLTIYKNDFIAIMGPSGSGKTTLLNILSTIDKPTQGTVMLDNEDITRASIRELSRLRRDKIGFVFQDYNLLDTMTLQDNIALPLSLNGVPGKACVERTAQMAEKFGLKEHLRKYPYQLSGGQKQRGAACRALITEPEIILRAVNDRGQATILMVTHDPFSASYAKDVYMLSDGVIRCRISRGTDRKEFYDRIVDVQTSMGGDFSWES